MLTIFSRRCRRGMLLALAWAVAILPAPALVAHEGHDHGGTRLIITGPAAPRLVVSSERYELVGLYKKGALTLYLDRGADNAPVTGAKLTLTFGDTVLEAKEQPDGTYRVEGPPLLTFVAHEIIAKVQAAGGDDLLISTLDLTPLATGGRNTAPVLSRALETPWTAAAITFLMGLGAGLALRRRRTLTVVTAVTLILSALGANDALAHGGEDHGAGGPAIARGSDVPHRLDDGSLFVPKPTQRLLAIRTVVTVSAIVHPAVRFIGRVIPDPGRSGYVQSINGGRILMVGDGLPKLGQTVKRGDIFAQIEPPITAGDYSTLSERSGDLEQQITLAEAKVRRYEELAPSGAVARNQLEDARMELQGLRRRKDLIFKTRREPEVLKAPVDGVVTLARAVPGQVVEARDILFQIVDPASLWVEALAFDPRNAEGITRAYAVLESGERLPLTFQGQGRTLQQHATVLQFSVAASRNLSIGLPVTVLAERNVTVSGIVLPKAAVVLGANGESIVFIHQAPELFQPRPVKVDPIDGERVLVTGLDPDLRLVTEGAELLNQVR